MLSSIILSTIEFDWLDWFMLIQRSLLYSNTMEENSTNLFIRASTWFFSGIGGWGGEKAGQKLCVPSQAGMADRGRLQAAMWVMRFTLF